MSFLLSGVPGYATLIVLGTAGFGLFRKLRLPLPALLGSLFATGALAAAGAFPNVSIGGISFFCKIAIGIMTGLRIDRRSVRLLKTFVVPTILVCCWMIGTSIVAGALLAWTSHTDLPSAMIGSATGGVTEMAIFALSQNYDVATVTFVQVFRLVIVILVTPLIARIWRRRIGERLAPRESCAARTSPDDLGPPCEPFGMADLAVVAFFSIALGMFFDHLHVPAGPLFGGMIAVGAVGLARNRTTPFPTWLRNAAQIGLGFAIAQRFDHATLALLPRLLVPLLLPTAFLLTSSVVLALLLQRVSGWDVMTCLLSTSAGGLSQMVVIAEEYGADPLKVGILHTIRYLTIIAVMPFLISFL